MRGLGTSGGRRGHGSAPFQGPARGPGPWSARRAAAPGGPNGSLRPVRIARAGHSHRTRARMILPWWARRGQDHGPLRVRLSTRSGPSQFFYSAEVYDHGDRWVQLAGSTGAGGPDSKSAWTGGRSRLTGHHDGPRAFGLPTALCSFQSCSLPVCKFDPELRFTLPVIQGARCSQYMPFSESRGGQGLSFQGPFKFARPAPRAGEPGRLLSLQAPVCQWIRGSGS
jgi:hypothetical protein